jgi:hypothetical protein
VPRSREHLVRSLNRWWSRQLEAADAGSGDTAAAAGGGWRRGRSVEVLAAELRRDLPFEIGQARFLHRRPDTGAAAAVVAELEPPPEGEDAEVLAEAIVRAGATARKVRVTTAAGAVLTVFALVLRNVLRGR